MAGVGRQNWEESWRQWARGHGQEAKMGQTVQGTACSQILSHEVICHHCRLEVIAVVECVCVCDTGHMYRDSLSPHSLSWGTCWLLAFSFLCSSLDGPQSCGRRCGPLGLRLLGQAIEPGLLASVAQWLRGHIYSIRSAWELCGVLWTGHLAH